MLFSVIKDLKLDLDLQKMACASSVVEAANLEAHKYTRKQSDLHTRKTPADTLLEVNSLIQPILHTHL